MCNYFAHGAIFQRFVFVVNFAFFLRLFQKAKAYDICFNHINKSGNLIYNHSFRNSAKEFFYDAKKIPQNPDGYTGNCKVVYDEENPKLLTEGETTYLHYGIPIGSIRYSANISGKGAISIYAIKNNSPITLHNEELELLNVIIVHSDKEEKYLTNFYIADNPRTDYEQICEGLGEKIMGIKIVYSSNLCISNIDLTALD